MDAVASTSFQFTGNLPGPKGEACNIVTPLECFLLFLTTTFHDEILAQSNLYANQQRMAKNDHSPWTQITKEELMAFIGINIAMGLISLPSMDDYWSTDPILSHAWFRTVM